MPDSNLGVRDVRVLYGPKHARVAALDRVTLDFYPGEVTLVMGPSGSGKTTLLSLLGCLLTPDEGSVRVHGQEVHRLSEGDRSTLRSRVGFVFQAFRLFHSLPALENVMVSADISSSRAQSLQTARDLLTGLGLGRKLHLKPDALSGGEKQRVAIARALLGNPQILLADEPTASLDAATGKRICEILRDATLEHRRTLVVVSHDPRWIPFADRIVDLEDGKVTDDRRTDPCAFTSERGTAPSSLLGSPSAVHS